MSIQTITLTPKSENFENFEDLFNRDFIRHVLLRFPSLSRDEALLNMQKALGVEAVYTRLKREMINCISSQLPADITMPDGKPCNVLPENLNPDISSEIVEIYGNAIHGNCRPEEFIDDITACIEQLCWVTGVEEMTKIFFQYICFLRSTAEHYRTGTKHCSLPDDLIAKYQEARRITLSERLLNNNSKDIQDYLDELRKYTRELCEERMYRYMSTLFEAIADSERLQKIYNNLKAHSAEAAAALKGIPQTSKDSAEEKEYRRLTGIDFFCRNVAQIDEAAAYRM